MGQAYSTNDYQLVCECSAALERVLRRDFHAVGTGLGELCYSARLPVSTRRHIKYVADHRNKMAHDGVKIDRDEYIQHFELARDELQALKPKTSGTRLDTGSSDGNCTSSADHAGGLVLGGLLAAAGAIALAASTRDNDNDEDKDKERRRY